MCVFFCLFYVGDVGMVLLCGLLEGGVYGWVFVF